MPLRWDQITPEEYGEQDRRAVETLVRDGVVPPIEKEYFAKDGRRVPMLMGVGVLDQSEGTAIAVAIDLTARKRLEAELQQSQKMEAVGRLAGGVAHDFNNLLTVITGYCQLALSDMDEADRLRPDIEQVLLAGQRAAGLTRQLLAFSRKQVIQPRVLDLNQLASNLENLLGRLLGEDIAVKMALDPILGSVCVDPGQMEQVIMNLAVNARDAMPRGGNLTIETKNEALDESYGDIHPDLVAGRYARLTVSDTGSGMDKDTLAHLFEPFFTTKPQGQGTGLGLSMVYGIVKQSGGHILVYSEPGQGTTFKVYLPRVDDPVEAEAPPIVASGAKGTAAILVVEDEEAIRKLVCTVLQRNGYSVLQAGNGLEALRLAEASHTPIDLLLTDLVMPAMGGRDLADKIVARCPTTRVLFMSGYTDDTVIQRGRLEPGTAYMSKPFTPDVLLQKIREAL